MRVVNSFLKEILQFQRSPDISLEAKLETFLYVQKSHVILKSVLDKFDKVIDVTMICYVIKTYQIQKNMIFLYLIGYLKVAYNYIPSF